MATKRGQDTSQFEWLRLPHIIGDPEADPPIPAMVPVSKSTLYRWISKRLFPAPIKPTPSTSLWSNDAVKSAIKSWEQNNDVH